MPINPELKICFIHIPKTGGTSIETLIPNIHPNNLIGIEPWKKQNSNYDTLFGNNLQHLTFNEIIKLKPEVINENYFIFTAVRNPYDRLISLISWKDGRWKKNNSISQREFNNYITDLEKRWIKCKLNIHEKPQHQFIDENYIDYIIKLEEMNEETFRDINSIIKIKNFDINFEFEYNVDCQRMKSNHNHYLEYYNKNTKAIQIVNNIYYMDFKKFGYSIIQN